MSILALHVIQQASSTEKVQLCWCYPEMTCRGCFFHGRQCVAGACCAAAHKATGGSGMEPVFCSILALAAPVGYHIQQRDLAPGPRSHCTVSGTLSGECLPSLPDFSAYAVKAKQYQLHLLQTPVIACVALVVPLPCCVPVTSSETACCLSREHCAHLTACRTQGLETRYLGRTNGSPPLDTTAACLSLHL